MIRYAIIAAVAVVAFLWYKSREAAALRPYRAGQPQPSVWTALGQLLGGGIGAYAATPSKPAGQPTKVSADGIYSRMGNQSPTVTGSYTAAQEADYQRQAAIMASQPWLTVDAPDDYGTRDSAAGGY